MIQAHPIAAEIALLFDIITENKNKISINISVTFGTHSFTLAACLTDLTYIARTNFSKFRHAQ
jgi:hypothetical protein